MSEVENDSNTPAGIVVPHDRISVEALAGLIDEFILREGTDYGAQEVTLEKKHEQVFKQLRSGRIVVVFDPSLESCSIVRKEHLPKEDGR
jgi:uncharacterized protein